MTPYSSPPSAQRAVPAAARLAIVVLMAGALVYGWQSAGVGRVTKRPAQASNSQALADTYASSDSAESRHLVAMAAAVNSIPAQANGHNPAVSQASSPAKAPTVPSAASRRAIFAIMSWIMDCTVTWVILPLLLLLYVLHRRPALMQRAMSLLNDYGALLLAGLTVTLLILASVGFQGMRHSLQDSEKDTAAAASEGLESGRMASRGNQNVVHDFYQILQLLNFNTEADRLNGVLLWAAIFAGLIAVLAAREILQALFYDLLVRLQLLLAKDHIVVIGLGRLGRQVLETMLSDKIGRRRLIVVLERDPQNPNLRWARQKGLLLVQGDGAETEDLWRVKLLKAHEVFVCIGADETNISCLTTIHELHEESVKAALAGGVWSAICTLLPPPRVQNVTFRPRCYVHIMNHDLLRAVRLFEQKHEKHDSHTSLATKRQPEQDFSKQALVQRTEPQTISPLTRRPDLEIFSTPERTIWKLMTELGRLKSESAQQPYFTNEDTWHYILLGFGEFGRTLALSLAEHSHTQNGLRVRMTICDRDMQQKQSEFLSRYSQFCQPITESSIDAHLPKHDWWTDSRPDHWTWSETAAGTPVTGEQSPGALQPLTWVCRADFLEYQEATDDSFLDKLIVRVCQPGVRTAVFICFEDEKENFTTSLRVHQKLQDRIQQTTFPKHGTLPPADPKALAARLCWPVFAWLPRQLKLAKLITDIEVRVAEKQRADREKKRKKDEEKKQQAASAAPQAEPQKTQEKESPHLHYRPTLIAFGQNYENISYPEITGSWLDGVAKLINLVWEKTGNCEAHKKLVSLVRLHDGTERTANPWERVFNTSPPADESAPEPHRIDEWLAAFAEIQWDKLEQTADEMWRRKEEWERYSNRSAAIHSVLKAAFFGLQIEGRASLHSAPVVQRAVLHRLTYGILRKLSEMEHNRWTAERLLDGWWFHDQRSERIRWQLTPFSCLPQKELDPLDKDLRDQREKDARIIMLVLGLIATGRLRTTEFTPARTIGPLN